MEMCLKSADRDISEIIGKPCVIMREDNGMSFLGDVVI